jgi:hypothetical protein
MAERTLDTKGVELMVKGAIALAADGLAPHGGHNADALSRIASVLIQQALELESYDLFDVLQTFAPQQTLPNS